MSDREKTVKMNWPSRPLSGPASDRHGEGPVQRILVADDSEPIRTVMADVLPAMGYAVTTACDGPTALEELVRWEPHLVLLDVEMPGIDGCEVCRRIKSHPETQRIPVMLVSGRSDLPEHAARAGADGFLQKPFLLDDLIGRIRALLGPAAVAAAEPG